MVAEVMTPDPLAGLRDLALPPSPDWLPPQGPGGWLLALLALAALAWGAQRLWRRHRRNRYRREALVRLAALAPRLSSPGALAELSALLKITALMAFPREAVAALTGIPWRTFLCTRGGPAFAATECEVLFTTAYQAAPLLTSAQAEALLAAARQWIVGHGAGGVGP